jgi:acetylornithine deacetylase/succinyl-diaminopimelate desuccinylase-like protein
MIDPAEAARKKRKHRNERIAAAAIVLVVAGLTGAAIWLDHREEEKVLRDIRYIPRQTVITPEIQLLRDYVRIDTSTPRGAADGARWLAKELGKRGVRAELIESTEGRLNVYARIKGRQPGNGLLLFNHIDVVPPGAGWKQKPFAATVEYNQMYGRGTLDMKGVAVTQMLAFAEIARSGRPPQHDLVFLATAEEEQGSRHGLLWLLANRPDVIDGIGYGITEGGLTEVMTEKMTYFGIEIGGKQMVKLVLDGKDEESLRQARFVLQRYVIRREPDRVIEGVRSYFRDIAPTRVSNRPHLQDVDAAIAGGEFWKLPLSYRDFTQNSLWVSAPYLDAGQWKMQVRLVNLPDADPDERIAWVRNAVARFGATLAEVTEKNGPVPLSPSDTPLFRILGNEARKRYQVEAGVQVLFRSVTDSRFLRTRGIVCYGVSPFPVDYFQSTSIHGRDERIRLDWFAQGIVYMRDVVRAWAFPPAA